MLIPRLVEIAIKILDIIERADIEWVPSQSIIEHIGDEREPTVQTILARLVMADILSAKRGPCGGYKQEYSTSLQMLMRICAPSCLDIVPSKSEDVNKVQRRILQLFADTTFTPKTPTIYKTASTDAHEPTEGLPMKGLVKFLPDCRWQFEEDNVTFCRKTTCKLYGTPCSKRCEESESYENAGT